MNSFQLPKSHKLHHDPCILQMTLIASLLLTDVTPGIGGGRENRAGAPQNPGARSQGSGQPGQNRDLERQLTGALQRLEFVEKEASGFRMEAERLKVVAKESEGELPNLQMAHGQYYAESERHARFQWR